MQIGSCCLLILCANLMILCTHWSHAWFLLSGHLSTSLAKGWGFVKDYAKDRIIEEKRRDIVWHNQSTFFWVSLQLGWCNLFQRQDASDHQECLGLKSCWKMLKAQKLAPPEGQRDNEKRPSCRLVKSLEEKSCSFTLASLAMRLSAARDILRLWIIYWIDEIFLQFLHTDYIRIKTNQYETSSNCAVCKEYEYYEWIANNDFTMRSCTTKWQKISNE